MADIYKEVGGHVRARRLARGMTLEELAERAGLSAPYLGQVERGVKKASLMTLAAVAAALDVPIVALFSDGKLRLPVQTIGRKVELIFERCSQRERTILLASLRYIAAELRKLRKRH